MIIPNTLGLKAKIAVIMATLMALRTQASGGRNISLRQYLAENHKDGGGSPLTPGRLFADLGIDPQRTTVDQLMSDGDFALFLPEIIREGILRGMGIAAREQMAQLRRAMASMAITGEQNGGQRFISPEVFMDPVMRGAVQATFYPDLIVREETVSQPSVTVPHLDLSEAKMADSEEGATIEVGSVTYDTKLVQLFKVARGIQITYEAIRYNSLSLVALYFEDLGRILGSNLNGKAVTTIVNGDQDDLSEAAAVIGVEDTAEGVTWFDVVRACIRLGLLGRVPSDIIANETMALDYLNLPEVKNKQVGEPLMPVVLRSPMAIPRNLFVSPKVGANKVVIQDSSASLVQLTAAPLLLETEKIVRKQIEGTYASITTGFAKLQRNASIVINGAVDFNDGSGNYDFPDWMAPYSD